MRVKPLTWKPRATTGCYDAQGAGCDYYIRTGTSGNISLLMLGSGGYINRSEENKVRRTLDELKTIAQNDHEVRVLSFLE